MAAGNGRSGCENEISRLFTLVSPVNSFQLFEPLQDTFIDALSLLTALATKAHSKLQYSLAEN